MQKTVYTEQVGRLKVCVYENRDRMGKAAAEFGAEAIKEVLARKEMANVVFAAAPSQFELYEALIASDIDFTRVRAFHMDEYIGIDPQAPAGFGNLLRTRLFSKLPLAEVNYFNPQAEDPQAECERMAELLKKYPPDVVFHGMAKTAISPSTIRRTRISMIRCVSRSSRWTTSAACSRCTTAASGRLTTCPSRRSP